MKICILDIETSPLIAYSWGPSYETNLIEVIEQSQVLSFSAKWLGGKHITKGWPDYKGYKKGILDDRNLIKDLWEIVNEADVIVGQNLRDFDMKILNARFLFHGLKPPSPYKTVDTKVEAKKYLRMPSNKLDDLGGYYGIGRKVEHEGFGLWKKCMAGDKKAWRRMKRYNYKDVVLTERLYILLRPWMQSHPNYGMYHDKICCVRCGSWRIQSRGYAINNTTKYRRLHCQKCGAWMKAPSNVASIRPLTGI